eukprot:gb/GECG01003471.1/.p1 GENE.gb/GECG01003471.1/~~gb/GECG01003471.1/.p1  ORF type:complete len:101 (+),score=10.42 gb/GECG01003471.1/:1-303(+)
MTRRERQIANRMKRKGQMAAEEMTLDGSSRSPRSFYLKRYAGNDAAGAAGIGMELMGISATSSCVQPRALLSLPGTLVTGSARHLELQKVTGQSKPGQQA